MTKSKPLAVVVLLCLFALMLVFFGAIAICWFFGGHKKKGDRPN